MRGRVLFLGMMLFFALAWPASAQFSAFGTAKTTPTSIPSSVPSFFANPLAKPNFTPLSSKPNVPGPLNLPSMMPSFSNLGNSVMLRNIFAPQMTVQAQRQQAAATGPNGQKLKRKNTPFQQSSPFLP